MNKRFEDKVVLVTGGSTGIGRATMLAFAREGAKVVGAARGIEQGEQVVREIEVLGGEALFIQTDVTDAKAVQSLVERTIATYGRMDCAFNNAGIGEQKRELQADVLEQDFDRVMDVNLKGIWLCMKYEIKQMLKQGGGVIVNNSSICGLVATLPRLSSYITSKHALIGLTRAAAMDYAEQGVRINAICPGSIMTPQLEEVTRDNPDEITYQASLHPMNRLGTTDEIAAAVLWLCSDESTFVHGHPLAVDGGFLAR